MLGEKLFVKNAKPFSAFLFSKGKCCKFNNFFRNLLCALINKLWAWPNIAKIRRNQTKSDEIRGNQGERIRGKIRRNIKDSAMRWKACILFRSAFWGIFASIWPHTEIFRVSACPVNCYRTVCSIAPAITLFNFTDRRAFSQSGTSAIQSSKKLATFVYQLPVELAVIGSTFERL